MTKPVLVVAGVYDGSGMATWCIEAAEALAALGERVCLACLDNIQLPPLHDGVHVIRIPSHALKRPALTGRLRRELARLSVKPRPFLQLLRAELGRQKMTASAFLLNAPFFLDTTIATPQFVVAWAYPPSFIGYMRKVPTYIRQPFSIEAIRILLDNIGCYRSDWHGFRHATGVMSVSTAINHYLQRHRVQSTVVHPGLGVPPPVPSQFGTKPRIVMMAVEMESPRKRIHWMLSALRDFPIPADLTLIGSASDRTRTLAEATGMTVTLTGRLPRNDALQILAQGNLFLFGSIIDDWGYVLLEAMARGLAVVAPDQSPFNEMVGPLGKLFTPDSTDSFRGATMGALSGPNITQEVRIEWLTRFNRETFGRALLELIHHPKRRSNCVSDP